MSYVFTFIAGMVAAFLLYHFRGPILSKLGINFPPKPPSA